MKDETYSLVKRMLFDAVAWQESYVDSVRGTEHHDEAAAELKAYRAYVKRRYGHDKTLAEQMLDGSEMVALEDIKENATFGSPPSNG